jgi:hypothetical protein
MSLRRGASGETGPQSKAGFIIYTVTANIQKKARSESTNQMKKMYSKKIYNMKRKGKK